MTGQADWMFSVLNGASCVRHNTPFAVLYRVNLSIICVAYPNKLPVTHIKVINIDRCGLYSVQFKHFSEVNYFGEYMWGMVEALQSEN